MTASGAWLVVLGLLGVGSWFVRKAGRVAKLILGVFQIFIGGMSALYGAWDILSSIVGLSWASRFPTLWLTHFLGGLVQTLLGLALVGGFVLVLRDPSGPDSRATLRRGLLIVHCILGALAVALGAWTCTVDLTPPDQPHPQPSKKHA
jgi:hypothetical protein